MTITAKVIEDSLSIYGARLTTLQLTYPRFIHAEFMTHRVFSRNASSSRAIPVAKMVEMVRTDPAMPIHWGANQPGMQAKSELMPLANRTHSKTLWVKAANQAADIAEAMMKMGLHKQVANRLLEPFQHIHVVVTATEWQNFFDLRCHPDAQPEIQELATQMRLAIAESLPTAVCVDEWHLPYVTMAEREMYETTELVKISAARCARVSYLKHDGTESDIKEDLELYERLVGGVPLHASPIEHQATPDFPDNCSGNFKGWIQYRKKVEAALSKS